MQLFFSSLGVDSYEESAEDLRRRCSKCNKDLPLSQFRKNMGYYRRECKECARKMARESKALREKYGSPPEDYRCPICDRSATDGGAKGDVATRRHSSGNPWAIDHDHEKGHFRGWLCHKCNMGIGHFNDNVDLLHKAVTYLKNGSIHSTSDKSLEK